MVDRVEAESSLNAAPNPALFPYTAPELVNENFRSGRFLRDLNDAIGPVNGSLEHCSRCRLKVNRSSFCRSVNDEVH